MAERDRWSMTQMLEPMAREARAAPELAAFVATVGPLIAGAPRGDGHPVLVLPGLGGGDTSTRPLRWFLDRLGYRTAGWGLGTNTGPGRRVSTGLDELLGTHGRRARAAGQHRRLEPRRRLRQRRWRPWPQRVRDVVTLGSPLQRGPRVPPASR